MGQVRHGSATTTHALTAALRLENFDPDAYTATLSGHLALQTGQRKLAQALLQRAEQRPQDGHFPEDFASRLTTLRQAFNSQ